MEVQLNPDLQAKLSKLAAARGSDPEMLAREAAALDSGCRSRSGTHRGLSI
jgi:predicted transcriptional regulator